MAFFKSVFISFTIWGLAALVNAVLSGAWLNLFTNEFNDGVGTFFLVFIFTLVFSIPSMFVFWIVLLANRNETFLFRLLLKAGFTISILSSFILYKLHFDDIAGQQFFLSLSIVLSAITSIMIHHRRIKSITSNKINNHA